MGCQPTLNTKRLVLRPFKLADAPELQRLANAPEIAARVRFFAAATLSAAMPHASPIASSQAAVPSRPTGAEPTTVRPAAVNSRTDAE